MGGSKDYARWKVKEKRKPFSNIPREKKGYGAHETTIVFYKKGHSENNNKKILRATKNFFKCNVKIKSYRNLPEKTANRPR